MPPINPPSAHDLTEAGAIQALRRGEVAGLEILVLRHQLPAVRAAFLVTGDVRLAEDVVAAAFVQVYDRIAQFDPRRPFRPWFLKIVVNAARRAAERQARYVSLERTASESDFSLAATRLAADSGASPEQQAEDRERRQAVARALAALPPAERAAVIQRYYLGLADNEIAANLAVAPGTVRWYLHNARQRLRKWLRPLIDLT